MKDFVTEMINGMASLIIWKGLRFFVFCIITAVPIEASKLLINLFATLRSSLDQFRNTFRKLLKNSQLPVKMC